MEDGKEFILGADGEMENTSGEKKKETEFRLMRAGG